MPPGPAETVAAGASGGELRRRRARPSPREASYRVRTPRRAGSPAVRRRPGALRAARHPGPGRRSSSPPLPLGFLWLEKGAVVALGPGELSLRLWPLAAGVAALFVFAALSRELLRPAPGRFALLCFALSGSLVYYAAELKQYSFDVLLAAALPLLAIRAGTAPGGRAWWTLAIAGLLGVWFSHPLVFVLPGLVVYLALHSGEERDRTRRARIAWMSVLWATGFAAAFLLTARGTSRTGSSAQATG